MRAQRRPQWPGLHPLPGNNISHIGIQPIQQCGQFAGMRSDNDLRHNMARQQIQRAGINHNGRHALRPLVPRAIAILQRVMIQQRGNGRTLHVITGSNVTLGGHAGSNHPRLHPSLAQHSLRQHGQYHILRTLWPQITHHAHIRARRGPRRQHGSTRIPRRTSHQTNHSTRILAIRKRRKTNRIRHKIAIRHLGKRNSIIDIETEIHQRDPSASIRSRRHHRTRLHRTERHRHIRRNIRPRQRTIINTHTRRASTATTNGKSAEGSLFGNAGLSGNTPSIPKDEANVPATPRNTPATPIPVIASSTTCEPRAHSTAACSRSPASPAEKPDVHPGISAAGSNTNTRPPARTNALNASSCNERPTATAVTCAPSRANSAPAYKPSPPLSPAPANTVTRASSTSKSSSSSNDNVTRATAEAAIRINGTPSSNKGRSNCRTTSAE